MVAAPIISILDAFTCRKPSPFQVCCSQWPLYLLTRGCARQHHRPDRPQKPLAIAAPACCANGVTGPGGPGPCYSQGSHPVSAGVSEPRNNSGLSHGHVFLLDTQWPYWHLTLVKRLLKSYASRIKDVFQWFPTESPCMSCGTVFSKFL